MRAHFLHLPIALVAALLFAACGGNGSSASDCPPAGAGTELRQTASEVGAVTYLTGVTAEPARCGDRLVFEFREGVPGARVEYMPRERALVEDGSGERLEADGEAFLVVRLDPAATAESHGDELEFTYTGPRRIRPDEATYVQDVVKTGDFEAVVTWAIGLSDERPFRVTSAGRRVTIDLT